MAGPVQPWQCLVWSEASPPPYTWDLPPLHTSNPGHILLQISPLISCLSRQYSGLYLSPTLPTLLPASDISDRCTIGGLLHDYRNPPPTDYLSSDQPSTDICYPSISSYNDCGHHRSLPHATSYFGSIGSHDHRISRLASSGSPSSFDLDRSFLFR